MNHPIDDSEIPFFTRQKIWIASKRASYFSSHTSISPASSACILQYVSDSSFSFIITPRKKIARVQEAAKRRKKEKLWRFRVREFLQRFCELRQRQVEFFMNETFVIIRKEMFFTRTLSNYVRKFFDSKRKSLTGEKSRKFRVPSSTRFHYDVNRRLN